MQERTQILHLFQEGGATSSAEVLRSSATGLLTALLRAAELDLTEVLRVAEQLCEPQDKSRDKMSSMMPKLSDERQARDKMSM